MQTTTEKTPAQTQSSNPVDREYWRLFNALEGDTSDTNTISLAWLSEMLERMGIQKDDPRITLPKGSKKWKKDITYEDFKELLRGSKGTLLKNALEGQLIIPDWPMFEEEIGEIFEQTREARGGQVANYIPQLGRVDPEQYGISICTIDGQRTSFGDHEKHFSLQSIAKPITYCVAMEEFGEEKVHQHVGREPSGTSFNNMELNHRGRPHNPMINSGAIVVNSLIKPHLPLADRFDHVLNTITQLSGNMPAKFNNSVFLSERQTADRNFALGYFMREHGAFPEGTNLLETLEFYFQCCSIEVNCEALAITAASLANAGICPLTEEAVLKPDTAKNCLSLMASCGMYDFSGEFAFTIGLPAKSGVGGGLMIVVPNVMGIAIWSPRLDPHGNSVRGIEFCKALIERYNFHNFDSLITNASDKSDPRLRQNEAHIEGVINLCWAASTGDIFMVQNMLARGFEVDDTDYDRRTPLHLAAAEGHVNVVEFLLKMGASTNSTDRWGNVPIDDARKAGHGKIVEMLERAG